jgi:hypothetical protein
MRNVSGEFAELRRCLRHYTPSGRAWTVVRDWGIRGTDSTVDNAGWLTANAMYQRWVEARFCGDRYE